METILLHCENLVPGHNGRAVSAPLTFRVGAGAGVCVVGENGAGKTTLLRTLL